MSQNKTYQDKWEGRSSVRTRPRKPIDFSEGGFFFPPGKQILLLIPEVMKLGADIKRKIMIYSFYKYLNDIVKLETKLIVTACQRIIYENLEVNYPESTKLNACTIIIDEYYHVYIAKDMIEQLDREYPDLPKLDFPGSDACNAVTEIKRRLEPKYREIFEIIAVCIFETTLVRELVEFFNDNEVHPSIRHYVNDHMNDESRHYSFFYDLLVYTWSNLPEDYQKEIGQHLGGFVKMYLNINSEKLYNLEILNLFLQDRQKATKLVEEIYNGFDITAEIPIVKNVLQVLKKAQLMDCAFVKDGFTKNGLDV